MASADEPDAGRVMVCRAVAHWDHAVFAHTATFPVAVDDGCSEDVID